MSEQGFCVFFVQTLRDRDKEKERHGGSGNKSRLEELQLENRELRLERGRIERELVGEKEKVSQFEYEKRRYGAVMYTKESFSQISQSRVAAAHNVSELLHCL